MLFFLKPAGFVNLLLFICNKSSARQKAWIFSPESSTKVSVKFKLENVIVVNKRRLLILIKSYDLCAPSNSIS